MPRATPSNEPDPVAGGREADVILDVVFEDGLLFLVVANVGDRPAHRVRVKFEQPFSGLGGSRKMHSIALFRKLEFLAPRKEIRVFLDRSGSYFARGEPTTIVADIAWRTTDGRDRSQVVRHDLEVYRDLVYIDKEAPA
jgi:hypothetical protein